MQVLARLRRKYHSRCSMEHGRFKRTLSCGNDARYETTSTRSTKVMADGYKLCRKFVSVRRRIIVEVVLLLLRHRSRMVASIWKVWFIKTNSAVIESSSFSFLMMLLIFYEIFQPLNSFVSKGILIWWKASMNKTSPNHEQNPLFDTYQKKGLRKSVWLRLDLVRKSRLPATRLKGKKRRTVVSRSTLWMLIKQIEGIHDFDLRK